MGNDAGHVAREVIGREDQDGEGRRQPPDARRNDSNKEVLRKIKVLEISTVVERGWEWSRDVISVEVENCEVLEVANGVWDWSGDVQAGEGEIDDRAPIITLDANPGTVMERTGVAP